MLSQPILTLLALTTTALSLSLPTPRALPSGTVTCGSNKYSVSAITAAINAGVKDLDSGNLPGEYREFFCLDFRVSTSLDPFADNAHWIR